MSEEKIAIFRINNNLYGCSIAHIKEIVRMQPVTELPNTADFIEGLTQVRSELYTIASTAKILGVKDSTKEKDEFEKEQEMIILLHPIKLGLKVDEVVEITEVDESDKHDLESMSHGESIAIVDYVIKLKDQLVNVLNGEVLLDKEKLSEWLGKEIEVPEKENE